MGMFSAPELAGASYTSSWNICSYPLDTAQISSISSWTDFTENTVEPTTLPSLFKTTVRISEEPKDSFILMDGWSKGVISVNGRNLGRYWVTKGPQKVNFKFLKV